MELKFSLQLQSVTVRLDDKPYQLRELTGQTRDTYLDKNAGRLKMDGGKVVGLKTYDGIQSDLLSLCLHDPTGKLVPKEEIQRWPASVVTALFDEARRISKLAADEEKKKETKEEKEKNESGGNSGKGGSESPTV